MHLLLLFILLLGTEVDAANNLSIQAGGQLLAGVVEDVHEIHEVKKKSAGLLKFFDSAGVLGVGKDTRTGFDKVDTQSRGTGLSSGVELATVSEGDTTFIGSSLKGGKVSIRSGGAVQLLSSSDTSYEERKESGESVMWQAQEGHGFSSKTVKLTTIEGSKLSIDAAKIFVDTKKGGQQAAPALSVSASEQPNAEVSRPQQGQSNNNLLNQLQSNPNVHWNAVSDAYDRWDYKTQGLTQAGAAIIAIAVTAATAGTGTGTAAAVGATALGLAARLLCGKVE